MNFKLALATASALALLVGAAHAGDNFANVEQSGSDNDGVVTQGPGAHNQFGTVLDAALQQGIGNRLTILQQGNRNEVGTLDDGFEQHGDLNGADITQHSSRNVVGEVIQKGRGDGSADPRNTLTVIQGVAGGGGNGNAIWRVEQVKRGGGGLQAGNTAELTQTGSRNEIGSEMDGGVSQRGRNHSLAVTQSSDDNTIGGIRQRGRDAEATITQEQGNRNTIGDILQDGRHNTLALTQMGARNNVSLVSQDGRGNDATLAFDGNDNGVGNFEGDLTGVAAFLAGVGQGTVRQSLGANTLSYSVDGNRNRFGFSQEGDGNRIDGQTIDNGNEIVGYQEGDGNSFDFLQDGRDNQTALGQVGRNNGATIDITGTLNLAGVAQLGDRNRAGIDITGNRNAMLVGQFGNRNHADVTIEGNRNFAAITQFHSPGLANRVTLDIFGDRNNDPDMAGAGFDGPALAVAGLLVPGTITQAGSGNTITMNVGTATDPSSRNQFAFAQFGDANAIRGQVIGNGNQAVVVQAGSGNFTSFSQIGNNNIIGVSQ